LLTRWRRREKKVSGGQEGVEKGKRPLWFSQNSKLQGNANDCVGGETGVKTENERSRGHFTRGGGI